MVRIFSTGLPTTAWPWKINIGLWTNVGCAVKWGSNSLSSSFPVRPNSLYILSLFLRSVLAGCLSFSRTFCHSVMVSGSCLYSRYWNTTLFSFSKATALRQVLQVFVQIRMDIFYSLNKTKLVYHYVIVSKCWTDADCLNTVQFGDRLYFH